MGNILQTLADPVGSIGSAIVSGIGSIVGGSQQLKAQKEANKTNLQIARETNQQQLDMFNRGLEYNSFQNQRKMLEEAGFSPYALFGTSPQNAPAAPQLHAAQMMPEDAMGRAVGSAVGDMANNLLSLSQAFKNHEEATSKRIENKMLPYMLELQAKGYATQNDLLQIQKVIQKATMQDNIDMVGIQKLLTESNYHLTEQQITRAIIENAFETEYGGRMRQKQIDSLAAKAFSDFQSGILTSKEIDYLPTRVKVLLRQIKVDEKNAETNQLNAKANLINANSAAAKNYADAANVQSLTSILSKYGNEKAAREIQLLDKQIRNGDATYEQISAQTQQLRSLADYYKAHGKREAYQMLLDYCNLRYKLLVESMPDFLPGIGNKIGTGLQESQSVPLPEMPKGGTTIIPWF